MANWRLLPICHSYTCHSGSAVHNSNGFCSNHLISICCCTHQMNCIIIYTSWESSITILRQWHCLITKAKPSKHVRLDNSHSLTCNHPKRVYNKINRYNYTTTNRNTTTNNSSLKLYIHSCWWKKKQETTCIPYACPLLTITLSHTQQTCTRQLVAELFYYRETDEVLCVVCSWSVLTCLSSYPIRYRYSVTRQTFIEVFAWEGGGQTILPSNMYTEQWVKHHKLYTGTYVCYTTSVASKGGFI